MNIFRRIGLGVSAFVFSSGLSLFAVLLGTAMVFGTPDIVKSALRGSGLYAVLLQSFLVPETTPLALSGAAESPQSLEGLISPTVAQQITEDFIDDVYDLAEGRTTTLTFDQIETSVTDSVAATIQQKVSGLPPCGGEVPAVTTSIEDISALTCLPPGVTPAAISDSVRSQLSMNGNQTPGAMADQEGRTFADEFAFIPILYRVIQVALFVVPFIVILAATGVVFWSMTRREGSKRVAWIMITIGSLQAVAVAVGSWLFHQMVTQSTSSPATVQSGALVLFDDILSQLATWWIGTGMAYVILGAGVLLALYVIKRNQRQSQGPQSEKREHIDSNTIK